MPYELLRAIPWTRGPVLQSGGGVSCRAFLKCRSESMNTRNSFPSDWKVMLILQLSVPVVALLLGTVFVVLGWLSHPTAAAWLWAFGLATGVSLIGTALLFLAKLPQYRAGVFFCLGCRHLPPRQQRLDRTSFWLIAPSILVLAVLVSAIGNF
jgi:hypothetical protein